MSRLGNSRAPTTFPVLPTQFKVQLPNEVSLRIDRLIKEYSATLLVQPKIFKGKVVIEHNDIPVGGATHVVRVLVTADFEPKQPPSFDSIDAMLGGGAAPQPGYWESWQATMTGAMVDTGFEVQNMELYVHREGGWARVHSSDNAPSSVRASQDGDVWPEPNGEPPANKGIVNLKGIDLRQVPKLDQLVHQMLTAGATQVHDEVIVDMRDKAQRAAFWAFNAECKKWAPR